MFWLFEHLIRVVFIVSSLVSPNGDCFYGILTSLSFCSCFTTIATYFHSHCSVSLWLLGGALSAQVGNFHLNYICMHGVTVGLLKHNPVVSLFSSELLRVCSLSLNTWHRTFRDLIVSGLFSTILKDLVRNFVPPQVTHSLTDPITVNCCFAGLQILALFSGGLLSLM